MEASAIASKLRSAAVAESRFVVTEPRDQYEGHISLRERHTIGNLRRKFKYPAYSPGLGDDLKLFISLLLALMPLHRIPDVWSPKEMQWRPPNSASAMKFHRSYALKLAYYLGGCIELWRWRLAVIIFLTKKLPEGSPNELKRGTFSMTPREIRETVTEATYQYGMERIVT